MGDGRVDVSMIFAGVSLLISALAVPLALGRIGPNAFYGVRLQATLADRRVWFEVNRIIGRELVCVGVLLALIAGLGGLFLDLQLSMLVSTPSLPSRCWPGSSCGHWR